tara:strand:+ start:10361 stop:11068 length:708 start_codon:yes stop_codon:yes gene_type:complete
MSKKNLLNEATIRRFMKLADMEPLASPFVGRLSEMNPYGGGKGSIPTAARDKEGHYGSGPATRQDVEERGVSMDYDKPKGKRNIYEDEEEEHELRDTEDELGHEDHVADEEGEELDALADEPVGEEGALEPEVRARVEDALAGALEALAAELGDTLGVELDVETEAEEGLEAAEEEGGAIDAFAAGEVAADVEDAEDDDAALALEGVQIVDDNALINEVAKRVTARLVKAMAAKK